MALEPKIRFYSAGENNFMSFEHKLHRRQNLNYCNLNYYLDSIFETLIFSYSSLVVWPDLFYLFLVLPLLHSTSWLCLRHVLADCKYKI